MRRSAARKLGLGTRIAAFVLDALVALVVVGSAVWALGRANVYVPLELTLILTFAAYRIAFGDHTLGRSLVRHNRRTAPLVLGIALLAAGFGSLWVWLIWHDAKQVVAGSQSTPNKQTDAPLIVTSSLDGSDYAAFSKWLSDHGRDPARYLVDTASKHQVTILGERHNVRENLLLLNRAIPDLYHKAGVTCIAMECCMAADNADLYRLVTAPRFDRNLALRIARHDVWKSWGLKEYWDVFESVWRLNKSLPSGAKKMRVIGMDREWDMPSLALLGVGDNAVQGPPYERLRLFRLLLSDNVLVVKRDEIMARNVEKEAFAKDERAVVLVGAAHAYTGPTGRWRRMGCLLQDKHPGRVAAILLNADWSTSKVMDKAASAPAGFDIAGSPIARVESGMNPSMGLADMAHGCIYLGPGAKQNRCGWVEGYVTREMFIANRPFYEASCGRKLRTAEDADRAFSQQPMRGL